MVHNIQAVARCLLEDPLTTLTMTGAGAVFCAIQTTVFAAHFSLLACDPRMAVSFLGAHGSRPSLHDGVFRTS